MKLLRALWRSVTSLLLHASLFGLIGALLFTFLLGNFNEIKATLRDSQVYSTFVDSVISSNLELSGQNSSPYHFKTRCTTNCP